MRCDQLMAVAHVGHGLLRGLRGGPAHPLHFVLQPLRRRPDKDGAVVGDDAWANAAAAPPAAGAVSAIYKGSLVLDIY